MDVKRRKFLQISGAAAAAVAALKGKSLALNAMQPVTKVDNPLESYPDVGWEKVYHDQYRYDRSFTFCCSPNDTHQCRVRAFVRNGVVMRTEQNYAHQNYSDLYGNKATRNWNPRMCLKGYTFPRRVYGPYRLRYPMIRKTWISGLMMVSQGLPMI
jgi:nitrate reductase alpha subunit